MNIKKKRRFKSLENPRKESWINWTKIVVSWETGCFSVHQESHGSESSARLVIRHLERIYLAMRQKSHSRVTKKQNMLATLIIVADGEQTTRSFKKKRKREIEIVR